MPAGGHLGLLVDGGVQLSLFYPAKPQSSFDCRGSPWSVLYTPSAWRQRTASACASSGGAPARCAWVCGWRKLCKKTSLQVCPVTEESRLPSARVTGSCELPRWFSSGHEGPLMTECRGVPAQAAFLPAFQAVMHGLFSAQSYWQITWLPLLCNCKEIFLEVLCFSTCSFSQNVFFFYKPKNDYLVGLWCNVQYWQPCVWEYYEKKPTQMLVSRYCCIKVYFFFCLLIFTFRLHSSHSI